MVKCNIFTTNSILVNTYHMTNKCKCMRIGNSDTDLYKYKLKESGKAMEYSKAEKDIGVTIDNKLTFENHKNEKVNNGSNPTNI